MSLPYILYSNILKTGTLSATSEVGEIENVTDWRSYVRWEATSSADQTLTCDAGSSVPCDALGIAGHNLGTCGAELALQSSATGAWAGEETTQATASPTSDAPILLSFTSASAQYWRLVISSLGAIPEIGIICLGAKMEFPQYPDSPLDYITESPEVAQEVSKGGFLLGVVERYSSYTFSLDFTYIAMSWITATFDVFWQTHGRSHWPFFVSINEDIFSDGRYCRFPERFKYGKNLKELDYMEKLSLSFEGVINE